MFCAGEFVVFGRSHVSVLLATLFVPFVLVLMVRIVNRDWFARALRVVLAVLLLSSVILDKVFLYRVDALRWYNGLPMWLCDWALLACVLVLVQRRPWQWAFEWAYFFGLAGTVQALVTPDISQDFPAPRFCTFFGTHSGIVVAVLFMVFALGMRPMPGWFRRVFVYGQSYVLTAFVVNYWTDGNYGYLLEKPAVGSLMDWFGQWPFYVLVLEVMGLLSFCFYYAPFYCMDRWRVQPVVAE